MKPIQTAIFGLKDSQLSTDMNKEKKLREACTDFEAIILKQMIETMRKSIPKSGLLDNSYAHDIYQSMYDKELADQLAHGKGMGLGEVLYKQLSGQIKNSTK